MNPEQSIVQRLLRLSVNLLLISYVLTWAWHLVRPLLPILAVVGVITVVAIVLRARRNEW